MDTRTLGNISAANVTTFCAICGSEIAPYIFKGKHICPSCLDYVREYY